MMISSFAKKVSLSAAGAALLTLAMGTASQAASLKVSATTFGYDSGLNAISADIPNLNAQNQAALGNDDFFRISFDEGPVDQFIKSITIDLTETKLGTSDAWFDNLDFVGYDASPESGQTNGFSPSDITFSPVNHDGTTTALTVSFATGSFGWGDSFTFGVDTNSVGDDEVPLTPSLDVLLASLLGHDASGFNDTGADFGLAGVKFLVELESGETGEAIFDQTGPVSSKAEVTFANLVDDGSDPSTSVPEPTTTSALLAVGAIATRLIRRKA